MGKHAFRQVIEAGGDAKLLESIFVPDAELWAPMLTKPIQGSANIVNVVSRAARIAGPIEYTRELCDGRQTFLIWKGRVDGRKLEACTILVDGPDGLVRQMRVLMRPWPVSTLFRNAMFKELGEQIPTDYWELQPKPPAKPRTFTPIALAQIPHDANMVLHSPMLTKSVSGKEAVEQAVKLAHQVQSKSSYTSIIATPEVLVELFDCDADGHPMEGMWIQTLNADGRIDELTVMLRPYPAVTVLRNHVKRLAESEGGPLASVDFWELDSNR